MRKVVSNAGEHDGTEVYYYKSGWRIAQVDDGSGDMAKQYIHGTQYIDEVVMMRAAGRGDLYIRQDANWNVIAATDLGGNVVERYSYTPYGELFVDQLTAFGDRDGDADVDATDKGTPGTTCTTLTGACRILDLDFDGDYDSADATLFDALDQGLARHPGRSWSGVGQAVLWGGLTHDSAPKLLADRAPHIHSGVMQHLSRRVGVTSGYPTQSSNPVNYSSAASGIWVHPYQCPVSVDLAVREACERIKRLRDMLEWQYAHSLFGPCDIPGPISQAHLAFRMRLFRIRDMARRCEETSSNTKVLCIPCGFDGIAEASQSGWFRRSCQITICTDSTGNNQFTDLPFLGGEDPAASQVKTICHEMAHCQGNTNHNNYGSWGAGNADEAGNWCDGCYDSIMSGGGCRMCGTWGVPGAAAHPQYCPSTHW